MKRKLFCMAGLTLALWAATLPARAEKNYNALFGDPAPSSAGDYTIVIRPDTRYVNVQGGDTVTFVVGDKAFAWSFNVARTVHVFDLDKVAPANVLDHPVKAYVSPDPKYMLLP
jgi:hypothetical protein